MSAQKAKVNQSQKELNLARRKEEEIASELMALRATVEEKRLARDSVQSRGIIFDKMTELAEHNAGIYVITCMSTFSDACAGTAW